MAISKEIEQKINQLQIFEQSINNLVAQKQQFQIQTVEIESALSELEKTDSAYKIVGNVMVSSNKDDLKKELNEKKEIIELRIKNLEKQETQIKEKTTKMQAEVMEKFKKNET